MRPRNLSSWKKASFTFPQKPTQLKKPPPKFFPPPKTKSQKQFAAGEAESPIKAKTIKLGIDIHLDRYVVVRTIDGGTPQPPQRFEPAEFLLWVAKQITLAEKVFTCYEAGPFGYSLHRKLEKMGVTNYVVRPRDWDEYGKTGANSSPTPAFCR